MIKWLTVLGIVLIAIGTCLSLWSILNTDANYVGTVDWYSHQNEAFKKQKRQVIAGLILIILGSVAQIVAQFL